MSIARAAAASSLSGGGGALKPEAIIMATAAASAKALGIEVVRLKALNLILKITASGAIASQVGARLLEKINQQMRGFSTIAGQPINSSRGIVNDSTDGRKTRFALSPG